MDRKRLVKPFGASCYIFVTERSEGKIFLTSGFDLKFLDPRPIINMNHLFKSSQMTEFVKRSQL